MGDSRIVISVILQSYEISTTHEIMISGDSTLLDVMNKIHSNILTKITLKPHHTNISFDSSPTASTTQNTDNNTESSNGIISPKPTPFTISAYDQTYHPPKDLTPTIQQYDQPTGTNSITVQSLGWFPSARIVLFETDDGVARDGVLKSDVHYRVGDTDGAAVAAIAAESSVVMGGGNGRPLPSQMLHTVAARFDCREEGRDVKDVSNNDDAQTTNNNTQSRRRRRQRTEEQRRASLDLRIRQLNDVLNSQKETNGDDDDKAGRRRGKKKKVSQQVQRMLIKSRSQGDKKLRQEDRFFVETVLLLDDDDDDHDDDDNHDEQNHVNDSNNNQTSKPPHSSSTYRFYSKFTSVGKVATSVANTLEPVEGRSSELLVSTKCDGEEESVVYKRLPNTMRLYEAEASGYVTQFGRVIVRVYDVKDGMNATPSIT